MNDMRSAIVPKSDQQNADDFLAGPRSVTITGVTIQGGQEQPVAISFSGDEGKPYKPCKSMSRVLVAAWGPDAKAYVGRSLTLYRDPTVKWAGMEVGGIRISHMTDIDTAMTMALTATKGSRKPFTVKPLVAQKSKGAMHPIVAAQPDAVVFWSDQFAGSQDEDELKAQFKLAYAKKDGFNLADWTAIEDAKDRRKAALSVVEGVE